MEDSHRHARGPVHHCSVTFILLAKVKWLVDVNTGWKNPVMNSIWIPNYFFDTIQDPNICQPEKLLPFKYQTCRVKDSTAFYFSGGCCNALLLHCNRMTQRYFFMKKNVRKLDLKILSRIEEIFLDDIWFTNNNSVDFFSSL